MVRAEIESRRPNLLDHAARRTIAAGWRVPHTARPCGIRVRRSGVVFIAKKKCL
jgi:hypothetical protein